MKNYELGLYAFINCPLCGKENMISLYYIENPIDEKHKFDLEWQNTICTCGYNIQLKYLDNDTKEM